MMQRLAGGLVGGNERERAGGKLLELADRDDGTEQPTPSSQGHEREDEVMEDAEEGVDAAMASVITQVTARDQQAGALPPPPAQYADGVAGEEGGEMRPNWKNKFRYGGRGREDWGEVHVVEGGGRLMTAAACDSMILLGDWPGPFRTLVAACCLLRRVWYSHSSTAAATFPVPVPRRSIFCCLAPSQGEQYVRQDEGPVVIRPIAPQPPAWAEPVLGPQLPQDAGKKTLVLDLGERGAGG